MTILLIYFLIDLLFFEHDLIILDCDKIVCNLMAILNGLESVNNNDTIIWMCINVYFFSVCKNSF